MALHSMTDLGVPTAALVATATVRTQVEGWRTGLARRGAGSPLGPGGLRQVDPSRAGARFTFETAELEVRFLASDVVRLTWGPGTAPVPYALVDDPPFDEPSAVLRQVSGLGRGNGTSGERGWALRTPDLEVAVAADGAIRVARPEGPVLRRLFPPTRRGEAWEQAFTMRPGERFAGLGQQAGGVDLRGGSHRLWNRDPAGAWGSGTDPLYLGIPVLVGSHPDGDLLAFAENSTESTIHLEDRPGPATATVTYAGGLLRQYLVAGPLPRLLDGYTALTGRPALPPRWALGYHQCRWGYKEAGDIRAVLEGFATLGLPLSAVHMDIDYMDGYRVFTVDPARFPDLPGLAAESAERGVRLVAIIDPGVKVDPAFPLYRDGLAEGRFCTDEEGRPAVGVVWPGRSVFPDFTDPGTREWWGDQYRTLTEAGIAGIWHDMNEPTSLALWGDRTLPASTRHEFDGRGGDHAEAHNLYGLLMNRAGHEGLRRARPDRRPFIVSRSGWAGTARWAWNWTGDVETSWPALRQQVATVIGLGLSGVPYSGPDIGGFSGIPDEELYLRWLQLSVLLPFCRTHSVVGVPPREPWRFPEPTRTAIGAWIRFRYRLLPYLYTLAHEATETGAPLVRPLVWPLPDTVGDRDLWDVDDAFLLGDALLVAPVTEAGATARSVTLPPGRWSSWWAADTGSATAGTAGLAAPIDRMPVLVRAGAILPLDDGWAAVGPCAIDADPDDPDGLLALTGEAPPVPDEGHRPRRLAFHCWPTAGGHAEGTCTDDDGDGDGPVRRDHLRLTAAVPGDTAVLVWTRTGDYPPPDTVRVVLHGLEFDRAEADGTPVEVSGSAVDCPPFTELRLEGLRVTGP